MPQAARFTVACVMLLAAAPTALAQSSYPAQPIRFIVTTAPGGGLDSYSRLVAAELTKRAGQQVIVENRPGAGTTIGTAAVAKAKPDGYTVLASTSSFAISPAIYQKLPYDALRDFAPITMGAAALFLDMAQIRMTHVPYKAGSLAVVDLIGGQVPMMIDTISSVMPQVTAGKLRALGVSSTRRAASAPGIPAIAEVVPGYESAQWYGLWSPSGTPQEIVAWLHREATGVLRSSSVKERLTAEGLEVVANSPDEFTALIKADIAKWTKLVKTIGMSLL